MDQNRIPKPGEIYNHFKDKPYQIVAVATHTETGEQMVVYQALYGDFKTYVRPLSMFMSEVDHEKYPEAQQKYRFEAKNSQEDKIEEVIEGPTIIEGPKITEEKAQPEDPKKAIVTDTPEGEVDLLLMKFLDANSYSKKLDVVTSNKKYLNDRLINDMAVSLDCAVDDGPMEQRITGLINCLQAMCRFENRRLR